ncbi:MAG TPA: aminoglycoside phosphotransferase family protein [Nocardioides sp.]|uniref:aminoglycoside phosphotransferase family protein n=1 Tax=Nocardioides sp. TaxID=35761 RepID=UPI002F406589
MTRLHDDELEVDEKLVRRLLGTLSSAYDELPLRRLEASGSTNALFRLGDDLLVRVPRQPGGSGTIEKEQRWLPHVAPHLPVPVPEIVEVGEPGFGYPEKWSLVRYAEGEPPSLPSPDDAPRHDLARDLAAVVTGLRGVDVPDEAQTDPHLRWYRGEPLAAFDGDMRAWLEMSRSVEGLDLDVDAVTTAWDAGLALPAAHARSEPRWYHGDLLAENLLVRGGRLAAVLDFGGLSVGNPAVDLVVAWELLDPPARSTFRRAVGVEDDEWLVARGWALALGVMVFPYYWHTMPTRCAQRMFMVRQVLADAP